MGTRGAQDKVPAGPSWLPGPWCWEMERTETQSMLQEHQAGWRGAEGLPGKQGMCSNGIREWRQVLVGCAVRGDTRTNLQ